MKWRTLGWASVELEHDGQTLLIDCVRDSFPVRPNGAMVAPSQPGRAVAALVTHLHGDHADPVLLRESLAADAVVYRPEPTANSGEALVLTGQAETQFRDTGLRTDVVRPWEQRRAGPFRMTAVPAVDGLGDPQVSWAVECDGVRVLHAGDTLFHGYWWAIARAVGAIDVAFLPVNAAVVTTPILQPPSPHAAVMSPEEAALAGKLLRARVGVPIHYGLIDLPPEYVPTPRAAERFSEHAKQCGLVSRVVRPGEWLAYD